MPNFTTFIGGVSSIIALIVAIAALVVSIYTAYSSQYSERDHDELGETREELSKQMSEVEKNICDKLDAMNKRYSRDFIEIKNSTSAVQRQSKSSTFATKISIPQEHMRVHISQLYSKIAKLEEEKLQLEARCADLENRI